MHLFMEIFAITIAYIGIAVVLHAYWVRYGGWLYGNWHDEAAIVATFWPLAFVLYAPFKGFGYLFGRIEWLSEQIQEFFERRGRARRDAAHQADLPEARVVK